MLIEPARTANLRSWGNVLTLLIQRTSQTPTREINLRTRRPDVTAGLDAAVCFHLQLFFENPRKRCASLHSRLSRCFPRVPRIGGHQSPSTASSPDPAVEYWDDKHCHDFNHHPAKTGNCHRNHDVRAPASRSEHREKSKQCRCRCHQTWPHPA